MRSCDRAVVAQVKNGRPERPRGRVMSLLVRPTPPPLWRGLVAAADGHWIVAAADDTRRRIERDLHDGAQQRLVLLGLRLQLAEEFCPA